MQIIKQVPGFPTQDVSLERELDPYEEDGGYLELEDTYTQAELPVTWKIDILITVWDNDLIYGDFWTPQFLLDFTINP